MFLASTSDQAEDFANPARCGIFTIVTGAFTWLWSR